MEDSANRAILGVHMSEALNSSSDSFPMSLEPHNPEVTFIHAVKSGTPIDADLKRWSLDAAMANSCYALKKFGMVQVINSRSSSCLTFKPHMSG